MDSPVFKLSGILKADNEPSDFEGPLTLILQLLSKNKIEIRDIKISMILEQYLEYLDEMAELDLDIASEFVTMASHLTYIKTKTLLSGGEEEVSELEQLISSLEELKRGDVYLQIKSMAVILSEMYQNGASMMETPPEYIPQDIVNKYDHNADDILKAINIIIGREDAIVSSLNTRETVYPREAMFSITEKVEQVINKLTGGSVMTVFDLFSDCHSRTELVATLIAILELCRVGNVMLSGTGDDITITYTGAGREPLTLPLEYAEEIN